MQQGKPQLHVIEQQKEQIEQPGVVDVPNTDKAATRVELKLTESNGQRTRETQGNNLRADSVEESIV